MACDIKILFSGKKNKPLIFEKFVEFSESPLMEFAKALANDQEKVQMIIQNMENIYPSASDNLQFQNNVGNMSIRGLINTIPVSGGWPDISELEKVMNIDNLNIIFTEDRNGVGGIYGFYKTKIGNKDITYLRISKNQIGQFKNWLLSRLLAERLKTEKEVEYSEEFDAIMKHYKIDASELIKGYLDPSNNIKRIDYSSSIKYKNIDLDIESVIQDEIYRLQGLMQKRVFKTEFFNALANKLTNKGNFVYTISLNYFYQKLKELHKDKSEEIDKILNNKKLNELTKIDKILQFLKDLDPEFGYIKVSSVDVNNDILTLNHVYQTINSQYGLTYKEVQQEYTFIDEHKGWDIYERDNRFYIAKGPLSENSSIQPYKSKDDAILAINNKVNYESLLEEGLIRLKTNKEGLQFARLIPKYKVNQGQESKRKAGDFVKSLDIELDTSQTFTPDIAGLLNGTYNDFVNFINNNQQFVEYKDQILQTVNTAEKAVAFLYLTNKNKNYKEALDKISNAKYKYYYIVSYNKSEYSGKFVEVNTEDIRNIREYTDDTKNLLRTWDLPKAQLMQSLVNSIKNKLVGTGFTVSLMTQEEIKDQYGDEQAKAHGFVSGNKIIINVTTGDLSTPLHEYAHVFLGIIKATDFDKYNELVNTVLLNYDRGKAESDRRVEKLRKKYKRIYGNTISQMDIDEEVFADLYAGFILNGKTNDFFKFADVRNEITEKSRTIWDMISAQDKRIQLSDIWNYPISTLVNINSDMIVEELQNQSTFTDKFKTYRQAARWIGKRINDKEIKEVCQ